MARWNLREALAACAGNAIRWRHPVIDAAARLNPRPTAHAEVAPPGNNWPLAPADAERLLSQARIDLVAIAPTKRGVGGACKGEVTFPDDGRRAEVKWKQAAGNNLDGWNNNPRKELATYAVQRLFLAPGGYVVPAVALRCLPLAAYRRLDPEAKATIDGTSGVLGTLSLWLEHTRVPDVIYDPKRFGVDSNYAYHLANFNVFAYLVQHRDGRPGNILVADDDANRRVFAVDNGISFGGAIYNFFVTNWDVVRVPAIPLDVVARLRAVDRRELESLATLVDLRADAMGILGPGRLEAPLDPNRGVRLAPGRIQMGLTAKEIDVLASRIAALIKEVDDGTLAVF